MPVVKAPTRLDFGGGWTDVPPYPEERGGFVCNLAINRYATVRLHMVTPGSEPPGNAAIKPDSNDGESGRSPAPQTYPIVPAALAKARVGHCRITVESDFPVGAGLGGSSAMGVALAAALHPARLAGSERAWLAEWSRQLEVEELKIAGGRQDHYAAAFGGALGLTFGRETSVEAIRLTPATVSALEHRCLLAYTGESRISAVTINAVLDAYRQREGRVLNALRNMASLAGQMRDALITGDIDGLAALVGEHWIYQRSMHPAITTLHIDALQTAATAAGATGMKALGASGGGCVIVFAPEHAVTAVAGAISPLSTLLKWRVDTRGVHAAPAELLPAA